MLTRSLSHISLTALLWVWAVVVALIALNRGVDLLWGVLVVLVIAILVASLLPKWQVSGIDVHRLAFPSEGVVGQPLDLGYQLRVHGVLARYGIEIHEQLATHGERVLVAYAPAVNNKHELRVRWIPVTRGVWHVASIVIESRFPLGLTRARRELEAVAQELIVYPDAVPLRWIPLEAEAHPQYEQTISRRRGGRDEFYGLRDYRPGDEMRAIHWRAAARRNELVVKEYEHQQDRRIWMFLDLSQLSHVGRDVDSTVEYMVKIAHSVALQAHSDGIAVGMYYMQAGEMHSIDAGADRDTYFQIRSALARAKTEHQPSLRTWLASQNGLPDGGTWLLFNLWQANERVAILSAATQRHAKPLVVEFDKESFVNVRSDTDLSAVHVTGQRVGLGALYRIPRGADLRELFKPI